MQRLGALVAWLVIEYVAMRINALAPRDGWYYPIASVFNVMSISVFLSFRPTRLIVDLVKLTAFQLVTQAVGWALYALHFHPTALVYSSANLAVELATFLRFFIAARHDGDIAIASNRRLLRLGSFMGRRQSPGDSA